MLTLFSEQSRQQVPLTTVNHRNDDSRRNNNPDVCPYDLGDESVASGWCFPECRRTAHHDVTGVTYNGIPLTQAVAHNDAGPTRRAEMWYLVAPPVGTFNVVVTVSAPTVGNQVGVVAGAIVFTGVDQTNVPIRSSASADGAAGTPSSLTITSATGDRVLDTLAIQGNRTATAGAGQTAQWGTLNSARSSNNATRCPWIWLDRGGSCLGHDVGDPHGATSNWSQVAISIKPYTVSTVDSTTNAGADVTGATPTVAFTHTTAGTNRLLVVGVSMNITGNTGATVSGITYNAVALTRAGFHNDAGNTRRVEMWYLINPPTGTNLAGVVSLSLPGGTGTVGVVVGATTFTGVDQAVPVRSFVSADGAAASTFFTTRCGKRPRRECHRYAGRRGQCHAHGHGPPSSAMGTYLSGSQCQSRCLWAWLDTNGCSEHPAL